MQLDETRLELIIQPCSPILQNIIRKSWKQAKHECDAWEHERILNPSVLHPLEKRIGQRISNLHDDK